MKKVRIKFSLGWCIGGFLVHVGVTLLLCLGMFASAMGSFTHGPGAFYYGGKAFMWVWNPMVSMMIENRHIEIDRSPVTGPVLWSVLVGLFAGLVFGTFSKRTKTSKKMTISKPNLADAPLDENAGFMTLRQSQSAKKRTTEQAVPPNGT